MMFMVVKLPDNELTLGQGGRVVACTQPRPVG
jgi:hypothetical protein